MDGRGMLGLDPPILAMAARWNVGAQYTEPYGRIRAVRHHGNHHGNAREHHGATDPRRRWPTEKFAAVGDALAGWGYDVAGVLERADLVVSNDTGPLHLAAAVGAPTIGIYWCGNLINGGPPRREHNRAAISWRLVVGAETRQVRRGVGRRAEDLEPAAELVDDGGLRELHGRALLPRASRPITRSAELPE